MSIWSEGACYVWTMKLGRSGAVAALALGTASVAFLACVGDAPPTPPSGTDASVDTGTPDVGANDGSTDSTPSGDADAGPSCDLKKPFGTPTVVPNVNTAANEWGARLSSDELTIYLHVGDYVDGGGVGGHDIWAATRADRQLPFGAPKLVPNVNTVDLEGFPSVTGDGLLLYFSRNKSSQLVFDIWVASRATTVADFASPALVGNVNTLGNQAGPLILPDGKTLYFHGGAAPNIYRASNSGSGFGAPQAIPALDSPASDINPVTNSSDLTLYFASDRTDPTAKGSHDIWVSQRASTNDPFPAPTNVQELNSSGYDAPEWLSSDGCTIYLSSNRSTGNADIFIATRPK